MELDQKPTWEEIRNVKSKLDRLNHIKKDDPEFIKILDECHEELNLAWNELIKSKFKDSVLIDSK